MLHRIWFVMISAAVLYGSVNGSAHRLLEGALAGCTKALALSMELCGGYMFFCGLMEIARALRAERGVMRLLRPLLGKLMPNTKTPDSGGAVALNLAMNVLGMGNAATPAGLEAMRQMEMERKLRPAIRHDMEMFLILNATSLQLLPATVLTLRTAAGSADANAVLMPTILCTAFSTVTGVSCGFICRCWEEHRHVG